MAADTHTIEVDAETAEALARSAAERGMTIAELVAELAATSTATDELSELDRRWAGIQSGVEKTVPHDEVVRWLESWGSGSFRAFGTR